jgi:hypothetical protein
MGFLSILFPQNLLTKNSGHVTCRVVLFGFADYTLIVQFSRLCILYISKLPAILGFWVRLEFDAFHRNLDSVDKSIVNV